MDPSGGASPDLRLHGYAVSNFFNVAHAALLEKGRAFDLVEARASQNPAFLRRSPMGKIPVLETPHGWLAETTAILEYLEDVYPEPALRPADLFERAKARQLINVVQMYVEAPTRSLFPGVFFGGRNSDATLTEARAMLDRGLAAVRRLARPEPFLLGAQLSQADLFAFYCLDLADRVTEFVYQRSAMDACELRDWSNLMLARNSTQVVLGAFEAVLPAYLEQKNAAFQLTARRIPRT
jgi:glutathione S-transferase